MSNPLAPSDLAGRDLQIVQLVSRFKQLTSAHIHELLPIPTTRTPTDRALRRLTERLYLHRIERRLVGGSKGGSGQYCYGLGRRGYYLFYGGKYSPPRVISYHSLAIAETYLQLRRAEGRRAVQILGFSTEPDCWVTVKGTELRPDMYVDLTTSRSDRLRTWWEVDLGSESQKQLRGKLEAYRRAYNEFEGAIFPLIFWIATDNERAKELLWLIEQLPEQDRALFRVSTVTQVSELFG